MEKVVLYFSVLFLILNTGCSGDAGFSQKTGTTREVSSSNPQETSSEIVEIIDVEEIKHSCQSSPLKTSSITLTFPKPSQTCDWGVNGNLGKRDSYFQARIEQTKSLNLPEGSIICDAQFDFKEQDFLYDDHFILLFNKSIVASSYNFEDQLNKGVNNLLEYDWSLIAGMDWVNNQEELYCPQIPGAHSACSFPGHDQEGQIKLSYDPLYVQSIMASGLPSNHSFSMISIGDNDEMDCEHSEVQFTVQLKYVQ